MSIEVSSAFLRLPRELRNLIYGFVFSETRVVSNPRRHALGEPLHHPLTHTCRMLRAETRDLDFSTLAIRLDFWRGYRQLDGWLCMIGPEACGKLRRIGENLVPIHRLQERTDEQLYPEEETCTHGMFCHYRDCHGVGMRDPTQWEWRKPRFAAREWNPNFLSIPYEKALSDMGLIVKRWQGPPYGKRMAMDYFSTFELPPRLTEAEISLFNERA